MHGRRESSPPSDKWKKFGLQMEQKVDMSLFKRFSSAQVPQTELTFVHSDLRNTSAELHKLQTKTGIIVLIQVLLAIINNKGQRWWKEKKTPTYSYKLKYGRPCLRQNGSSRWNTDRRWLQKSQIYWHLNTFRTLHLCCSDRLTWGIWLYRYKGCTLLVRSVWNWWLHLKGISTRKPSNIILIA